LEKYLREQVLETAEIAGKARPAQAYATGGSFFASVSVIKLRELRKVARYRVVKNHFGYM